MFFQISFLILFSKKINFSLFKIIKLKKRSFFMIFLDFMGKERILLLLNAKHLLFNEHELQLGFAGLH